MPPTGNALPLNTGEKYDITSPDHGGWLTKQSRWLKDWRRRFFILKGNKLFFARTESEEPHGMIDLSTCMTVKSAELKAKRRNALEVRARAPESSASGLRESAEALTLLMLRCPPRTRRS
eukprot:scaffold1355_cov268-Pinguiococcus_pyrenoidosus.AAC.40